jgi:hypothetical protein
MRRPNVRSSSVLLFVLAAGCGGDAADDPGSPDAAADAPDAALAEADAALAAGPDVLGGGSACDLMAEARAAADLGEDGVDCGVATLADPIGVWTRVSDCLVDAHGEQRAFLGGYELANEFEPDTLGYAYVGPPGDDGHVLELHYDSDPSAGTNPETPPRIVRHGCQAFGVREACAPQVGWLCVACFDEERPDLADLCPGWDER